MYVRKMIIQLMLRINEDVRFQQTWCFPFMHIHWFLFVNLVESKSTLYDNYLNNEAEI